MINKRRLVSLFVVLACLTLSPLVALGQTIDDIVVVTYDTSNRPLSVTGLSVPGFFAVDINIDYGASFNMSFGTSTPPPGPLGGLTWNDSDFGTAVASALQSVMNADLTPLPADLVTLGFPLSTSSAAEVTAL
ncbi:hypothetical protein N9L06_07650 [Mariniblastus sp.]|nr:hypothetical protein [Mariniblastus sp.]